MKVLSFLPLLLANLAMAATVPTTRQTTAEVTCTTRWSAINDLIEDLEARVRVADPTFLTSFYGSSRYTAVTARSTLLYIPVQFIPHADLDQSFFSTRSCGGVTVQKFVDNILAVIATPDSWCGINGDGFGGYECEITYL
ncbi:hypothetical protein DFH06DRAFT_1185943 [Mycena polygramma]|nr:hypothetical protein DFH06DRAFT_1185943 [Mycena polygramma]